MCGIYKSIMLLNSHSELGWRPGTKRRDIKVKTVLLTLLAMITTVINYNKNTKNYVVV